MAPRYSITLFELYHPHPTPLYFFFARKTRDGMFSSVEKLRVIIMKLGPGVASWLRPCTTSRMVPESIPGGVIGDFFRGSFRQNHVSWGRLSLWKWVPGMSPGVKAAGAFSWRPTTPVVPKVEKIRGLKLPGTPWVTSACCGIPLLLLLQIHTQNMLYLLLFYDNSGYANMPHAQCPSFLTNVTVCQLHNLATIFSQG